MRGTKKRQMASETVQTAYEAAAEMWSRDMLLFRFLDMLVGGDREVERFDIIDAMRRESKGNLDMHGYAHRKQTVHQVSCCSSPKHSKVTLNGHIYRDSGQAPVSSSSSSSSSSHRPPTQPAGQAPRQQKASSRNRIVHAAALNALAARAGVERLCG